MKKNTGVLVSLLAAVLIVAVVVLASTTSQSQAQSSSPETKVIRWKGQYFLPTTIAPFGPYGPGRAGAGTVFATYIKWLNKATNGRLVIDMTEPGAIFKVGDVFDSVRKGVVNAAFGASSVILGKLPESSLESLPFLWNSSGQEYELYYHYGLYDEMKKVYAENNINWFPAPTNAIVGLATTFPVPKPESVKGKKIRAVGEMGAYMAMLGASPVSIPWGEAYMALKLGTVDGFVGGVGALEEQKLKEVVKYVVPYPNPYRATLSFLINMDSFKALPKDIQELIERDSRYVFYTEAYGWEQQCHWALAQAKREYGVKVQVWSDEDCRRVIKMAIEKIWPSVAAKNPRTARLLEIGKKQFKELGLMD